MSIREIKRRIDAKVNEAYRKIDTNQYAYILSLKSWRAVHKRDRSWPDFENEGKRTPPRKSVTPY